VFSAGRLLLGTRKRELGLTNTLFLVIAIFYFNEDFTAKNTIAFLFLHFYHIFIPIPLFYVSFFFPLLSLTQQVWLFHNKPPIDKISRQLRKAKLLLY
jgi:hypothetical protein